ncbi:MAG: carboxypeptidase regulatory-like domain-containing protein [Candidatus Eisenbacteria sp.]|nr:carboxypeptidase regulatory-like domain-containing protein [Candidatus Eisenbacteria bacterium]
MRTYLGLILATLMVATIPPTVPAQDAAPGAPLGQRSMATLSGMVTDGSGAPLSGVAVKVFEEGFMLEEVATGADGSYRLRFPYLPDIDWTIVAWYVPPSDDLVPEILILRESLRSKSLDLWSTCLPRGELKAQMHYDATLVDGDTKRQMISQLECFERQSE